MARFKNHKFWTVFASLYLILFWTLLQFSATKGAATVMFYLAPFVLLVLIYTVLKYASFNGKELNGKEYGYSDREAA